jgi:TnpA family transposase
MVFEMILLKYCCIWSFSPFLDTSVNIINPLKNTIVYLVKFPHLLHRRLSTRLKSHTHSKHHHKHDSSKHTKQSAEEIRLLLIQFMSLLFNLIASMKGQASAIQVMNALAAYTQSKETANAISTLIQTLSHDALLGA